MMTQNRPSAFSNMNKPKYVAPEPAGSYRSWKQKQKEEVKKEVNIASFSDFPDLVQSGPKKTVFEGNSLASKLKEVIAAEEEAAIQKRLKKGETPEMILRESCVILPLKGGNKSFAPLEVPDWVTDTSNPIVFPPFRHKTLAELADERRWKRLGINPSHTMLHDEEDHEEEYIEETLSLPSSDVPSEDEMSEPEMH